MIKVLNENRIRICDDILQEYPNCCCLIIDYEEGSVFRTGRLYCVSSTPDTYEDICSMCEEFKKRDISCTILGSYK